MVMLAFYGCTGDLGGDAGVVGGGVAPESGAVVSGARRLTRAEYDATLRDLLLDTTNSGFAKLPEDVHDPFDNDYTTQAVSPALIEAAETLAREAAERALADPAVVEAILPCTPSGPSDAGCLREFVHDFGRRALRRPLSDDEADVFVDQLQPFAIEGNDFNIAVKLVMWALLQDVEFLYRAEIGEPLGDGSFKLTDHEMATRLSYFLLGTTPPTWLLDAADDGTLSDASQIRAAAEKLIADPLARERVERFHSLWLGFHQLPHSAELVAEMRAESAALIDKVVFDEQQSYFELFRSEQTYLTDYLANHYSYDAPATSPSWTTYTDGRRGILSHGTVLSSFGKFSETSPTQRGIFIRTRLLCETIPAPPKEVNTDMPPQEGGDCKLDRYAAHNSGGCYNCHKLMDPIGLGLERYDNQGRYREHEQDKPECQIPGEGTIEGLGDFVGPAELSDMLIGSGKLEGCVVKQVYRFALGRRERTEDTHALAELTESFRDSNYDFGALLVELAAHPSFAHKTMEAAQ